MVAGSRRCARPPNRPRKSAAFTQSTFRGSARARSAEVMRARGILLDSKSHTSRIASASLRLMRCLMWSWSFRTEVAACYRPFAFHRIHMGFDWFAHSTQVFFCCSTQKEKSPRERQLQHACTVPPSSRPARECATRRRAVNLRDRATAWDTREYHPVPSCPSGMALHLCHQPAPLGARPAKDGASLPACLFRITCLTDELVRTRVCRHAAGVVAPRRRWRLRTMTATAVKLDSLRALHLQTGVRRAYARSSG